MSRWSSWSFHWSKHIEHDRNLLLDLQRLNQINGHFSNSHSQRKSVKRFIGLVVFTTSVETREPQIFLVPDTLDILEVSHKILNVILSECRITFHKRPLQIMNEEALKPNKPKLLYWQLSIDL